MFSGTFQIFLMVTFLFFYIFISLALRNIGKIFFNLVHGVTIKIQIVQNFAFTKIKLGSNLVKRACSHWFVKSVLLCIFLVFVTAVVTITTNASLLYISEIIKDWFAYPSRKIFSSTKCDFDWIVLPFARFDFGNGKTHGKMSESAAGGLSESKEATPEVQAITSSVSWTFFVLSYNIEAKKRVLLSKLIAYS